MIARQSSCRRSLGEHFLQRHKCLQHVQMPSTETALDNWGMFDMSHLASYWPEYGH